MPYSSLDTPLAEGITRVKVPAAVPLNIPLVLPKEEPGKERSRPINYEEQERTRQYFQEQREKDLARDAEIARREQAQREYVRNKVNSVYENNPAPSRGTKFEWSKYQGRYREVPIDYPSSTNQSSTPPSSASAPATPRTSGSGLGMNMQDSPNTGSPRTAAAPVDVMEKPPTGLPAPATEINAVQSLARNAAAGGATAGLVDFGAQLMSGRPVADAAGHAAFTAGGAGIGTVLGASAGSVLGPVGAYVGGTIGGMVGGGLGGYLYDQLFPRPAQPPPSTYDAPLPYTGGQSNATYQIFYYFDIEDQGYHNIGVQDSAIYYGPLGATAFINNNLHIEANGSTFAGGGVGRRFYPISYFRQEAKINDQRITKVQRLDGQPDTENLPPPPLIIDNRTYQIINNQINNPAPPRGEPAPGQNPAPNNYAPTGFKDKEGGTPRGDSPEWVPHGGLAGTAHPDNTPLLISPLPYNAPGIEHQTITTPQITPQGVTLTNVFGNPAELNPDGSVKLTTYGKSQDSSLPQTTNPESLQPNPLTSGNYSNNNSFNQPTPSTLPLSTASEPEPDATKKIPVSQPTPQTQTDTNTVTKDDFEQFKKDLEKLIAGGTILAGLTPAIQTIGDKVNQTFQQTTPSAITDASKQGCCDAFAPTGCNGDIGT